MIELYPGHKFELDHLHAESKTILQFSQQRPHHPDIAGPSTQEVLRACIARVQFLNHELPHQLNEGIIHHLRMAIAGFEARALLRKVEKGKERLELLPLGADGHIILHDGRASY